MKDIRLLGLTGKAGCGKDTFAGELAKRGWECYAMADPLKKFCIDFLGLSHDDVYTQDGKKKYNSFWGVTNREILQRVGTDALRDNFHKGIWIKIAEMYITKIFNNEGHAVITDVRFDNEAEMVERLGGIVVKIERNTAHSSLQNNEKQHQSELGIDNSHVAIEVNNNSTIDNMMADFDFKYSSFINSHNTIAEMLKRDAFMKDDTVKKNADFFLMCCRKHIKNERYSVVVTKRDDVCLEWMKKDNFFVSIFFDIKNGTIKMNAGNTKGTVETKHSEYGLYSKQFWSNISIILQNQLY